MTAAEALALPYFAEYHDEEDEPTGTLLEWDDENEDWKSRILEEVKIFKARIPDQITHQDH